MSIEPFAIVHGCDRGPGCVRHFEEGRSSFGGGRGSYDGIHRGILIRGLGNVSIAGGMTTSLRSAGESLVALNEQNWLMLTLLPLLILRIFMLLQPPTLVLLALPLLIYHRRSTID